MQRINSTIDNHHAIFPRITTHAARVEIFNHQQIVAGEVRCGSSQFGCGFNQDEILPGVKSRRAQQERKLKAMAGHCGKS